MNKIYLLVFAIVLGAALIGGGFYYFKLPKSQLFLKERTQQKLLNDFRADSVAGKLTNVSGTIVKINGNEIMLTTVVGGENKERNITLTSDTIIRRLTMPEIKPGDGLTPMIETFVAAGDLRIGDDILANLNKDGVAAVLDVMPASPSNSTTEGAATTTIKTIK
jgi:hypothetical protein